MSFKPIDLTKHCNHKLFYDAFPHGEACFGIENVCILKKDFFDEEKILKKDIVCDFLRGDLDNVVCDSQRIPINSKVKRWHFIGFSCWYDANEFVRIVYEDGTEDFIDVTFVDWSYHFVPDCWNRDISRGNKIENVRVAVSAGEAVRLVYFHDCICELKNEKTVKEIILPNNILVHMFALTIEK